MKRTMPTTDALRAALSKPRPGTLEAEARASVALDGDTQCEKPRRKQRPEADVKRAVAEWLTRFGYCAFRMNTGAVTMGKRFVRFGAPGMADFLVVLPPNGRCVWVEVKRPLGPRGGTHGSEQSPDQVAFALKAAEVGAGYRLVRSLDDLIVAIREESETARYTA